MSVRLPLLRNTCNTPPKTSSLQSEPVTICYFPDDPDCSVTRRGTVDYFSRMGWSEHPHERLLLYCANMLLRCVYVCVALDRR